MPASPVRIKTGSGSVTALRTPAEGEARWTFVYAPGAGSNVNDPFGAYAARELAAHGIATLRFQFPYMEAKKRGPDRPPCWRRRGAPRSRRPARTARASSSAAGRWAGASRRRSSRRAWRSTRWRCSRIPLHPPGKPDQLRDTHLGSIKAPALFCSGTNDAFASPEELRAAAKKLKKSTVHLLQAADHGFNVPKSSGRTREDVWAEAVAAMVQWLAKLK